MAAGTKKTRALCIATRCESLEQFIAKFQRFVDEDSFFIATKDRRPEGLETTFSIQLADKTPVLRGTCVVLQVWTNAANPFRLPGLRLGVKHLTASSIEVFERLLVTHKPQLVPEVLPANPLADMSDVSLEGFVDCALYEETVIEPPQPSVVVDEAQLSEPHLTTQAAMPKPEPPRPPPTAEPEPPQRWDSMPLLAASGTVPPVPRRRRRMHLAVAGAAVGIVAIAIMVPFAFATGDDEPAVRTAAVATAPVPRAVPVETPAPAPVVIEAPTCKIDVTSTPAGAGVTIDGRPAGTTPLALPVTCERHELEIAHVRYQPATRSVTPTAEQPSAIDVPLQRPLHQLAITSSPPGATIIIDGRRAGTTPATLEVPGFTVHQLAFVRRGFHTTVARHYSKIPRDHLSVQMAK